MTASPERRSIMVSLKKEQHIREYTPEQMREAFEKA